jgi:hypothetical protein
MKLLRGILVAIGWVVDWWNNFFNEEENVWLGSLGILGGTTCFCRCGFSGSYDDFKEVSEFVLECPKCEKNDVYLIQWEGTNLSTTQISSGTTINDFLDYEEAERLFRESQLAG